MLVARPFATATWRETGYLLLGAATAWIAFSVLLVTVIGGGLLALTILGFPILLLCFWLVRGTAGLDRMQLTTVVWWWIPVGATVLCDHRRVLAVLAYLAGT